MYAYAARRFMHRATANLQGVFNKLDSRLQAALRSDNIANPTPIQGKVIPVLLEDHRTDVVFGAETGSGKTLAYLLPLLHRQALLVPHGAQRGVRHLVLVPTTELADQVTEVASRYGSGITHALQASRHSLTVPPGVDILVTTPGILRNVNLGQDFAHIATVVLDEADMLLSPSFSSDMKPLLNTLTSRDRVERVQFVLCAATIATGATKSVEVQLRKMFKGAMHIKTDSMHRPVSHLKRLFRSVHDDGQKLTELSQLLQGNTASRTLVFANTNARVATLAEQLAEAGIRCAQLHKRVSVEGRADALRRFRLGETDVLVCTDMAARGLDLPGVSLVVEYDFALNVTEYLHRAGRTARAGGEGTLVSFVAHKDGNLAQAIAAANSNRIDGVFSRKRGFRRRTRRALGIHSA